ncbi:MAG: ice-binding family protein, partial [Bacteroidota bacterium]|nr:ice-binding family protein [Bacteroidota bacterium]
MKTPFLLIVASVTLLVFPNASNGQTAPALGAASGFALFTAVGAVDNHGPTVINGDIGTNAGAFNGFPPGVVNGNIHVADASATQAATAVQAAYAHMSGITYATEKAVYGGVPPVTLLPGSYFVKEATTLAGTLILDGGGDPNATFFLMVNGALTTGANSRVVVQNGASASNVYWQIRGLATLGQNSVMRGTLLVDGAINLITGAVLEGRGLSRAGAISPTSGTVALPVPAVLPALTRTFWLGDPFGTGTTDWFTAGNWSNGVPTSALDAVVPTGTAPYPLVASGSAAANSLVVGAGARFTQGGGTLDVKGSVDNSGTISATAGTVRLSGTAAQAIGGVGNTQFWGLAVANPAGASQAGAVSVHGALALASGSLATNGQPLTLLSDAAGTALVDNTGGTVNGTATVQRFIDPAFNTGVGYRHYSSPVASTTFNDLATAGFAPIFNQAYNTTGNAATPFPNVFGYDQARVTDPADATPSFDQGFLVPAGTDALGVLSGYTVNIGAGQVVDVQGTLTNGPVARTGLLRGAQPQSGWQFLGNPYPSPIDFSQVAGVTRTNVDDAVYVYYSTGQYAGQYRTYVRGFGDPNVASMQGFFVRVSTGQTTGSFALNNAVRVTTMATATPFNRGTADTRPLVQLRLQGSARPLTDETAVYFEQGASADFDAHFDAFKLPNSSGLSVSSLTAGNDLSVNGLALLTGATTVPLNVHVPAAGTYALSATSLLNFGTGAQVLLLDTETGARIDLAQQPSYTFQASAPALLGRFALYFKPAAALAASPAALVQQVQVYPNPARGSFTLLLPAELSRTPVSVRVVNQLGQLVLERTLAPTAASAQFDASALAPGVYSLRLTSANGQVVK